LIEVDHLSRTFVGRRKVGRLRRQAHLVTAADDLTFFVNRGEMVGYIGPNGAGESTTIKMLAGVLVPTAGTLGRRHRSVSGQCWADPTDRGGLRSADFAVVGPAAA